MTSLLHLVPNKARLFLPFITVFQNYIILTPVQLALERMQKAACLHCMDLLMSFIQSLAPLQASECEPAPHSLAFAVGLFINTANLMK